jgi:hypothetical protein
MKHTSYSFQITIRSQRFKKATQKFFILNQIISNHIFPPLILMLKPSCITTVCENENKEGI